MNTWGTTNEIFFLKNIGDHSREYGPRNPVPLLQGYLLAAHRGRDWGSINKDIVLAFAQEKLRLLGGKEYDYSIVNPAE